MSTRFTLSTIWCCFVARALFYCTAVPLWEGYDEYSHFALIQYVAAHNGRFPIGAIRPNNSVAVSESRKLTPAAWIIHDASSGILSYDEYFSLPLSEQHARRARLETLPVGKFSEEAAPREPLYEVQQPPLYYWILAPFYGLMRGWSIPRMVWVLRSLTVLIASTVVPLAFFVGRRVLRDDRMALGVALVVASFPELFVSIGHISNEGLSVAIGALFVLLVFGMVEGTPSPGSGARLGIALGTALLTKAYFLALIPLATVVLCYAWFRNAASRSQAAWQAAATLVSCIAISGWWYIHNLVVTRTLTGQFEDTEGMANTKVSLLSAVGQIHWAKTFDFVILSHIWLGDWSFLVVRTWMYRVVELMMLASMVGICTQAFRERSRLPRPKELVLLALPYLAMILGLCFHAAQVFRARGSAGTVGYYLYALVVPETILLIVGLARLAPSKMLLLPVPIATFILISMEQFGAWFIQFPYYAGLIRHNARGRLPTAGIEQFWNGGGNAFFDRLSGIGPASSPVLVAAAAVLYAFATVVLLWSACRIVVPARLTISAA